jgi:hypothetical protein
MQAMRGTGIWSGTLRFSDPAAIADAAAELEELGYRCLWIPDMGGDVLSVEQPFPVMRGGQPFRLDGMRQLAPALNH